MPALVGLRSALAMLAIVALIALFFSRRLPNAQPGSATGPPAGGGADPGAAPAA